MNSSETSESTGTAPHRLLVVAAEEVSGAQVRDAVAEHAGDRNAEVRLIAPALIVSALENAMGDVDDAIVQARGRAERSAEELKKVGIEAVAEVGDSDLRLAIQDALQTFDADEILIVAHREGGPYLERRGIQEAEHDFSPPITELFVEHVDDGDDEIADVEHKPAGQTEKDKEEIEGRSHNFPPFSPRDVLGIIVAIVGTIVLVVLAAVGSDTGADSGLSNQAVRILIAGAVALVNLAHVIGLTLFQAGPYRGFGRGFFARMSLIGTPLAIVVSALLVASD